MTPDFIHKLKTEIVYLWEDEAEIYVRHDPGGGYFGKYPGSPEFPLDPASDHVFLALQKADEVTRTEYYKD